MSKALLLALALLPVLSAASAQAAPSNADRARDYDTVKRIALRDPKVRAAYAAADRRLAERIVEIDPTLKGYKPGQPSAPAPKPAAQKPAPKPAAPAPARRDRRHYQRAHTVAKGETLAFIAAKYGVRIADLRADNEIRDERKLIVGQVLAIPNGGQPPAPKPAAKAPPKKGETTWWDQMGF